MELLRRSSSQCQQNFLKRNIKDLADNKKFWKTIKHFFSNKGLNSNKLMLGEKVVVVAGEKALVTLVKIYFVSVTVNLDLKRDSENFYDIPASVYNVNKKNSRSPKYFEN